MTISEIHFDQNDLDHFDHLFCRISFHSWESDIQQKSQKIIV